MPEAETLNLFVSKTDDPTRFRVAVDDPIGPSNLVEFLLKDELKSALTKLHARGPDQVFHDIPSQDVAASFIGEMEAHPVVPGWSICSIRVPCAGDLRRARGDTGWRGRDR
jgi:hypothetical protein